MKYTIYFLALAFFTLSCSEDDIKELTEITQDVDVSESFVVNLGADDPTTFAGNEFFDTSVAGVDISDVEIVSMTLGFSDYTSSENPVTITSANLTFANANVSLALPEINLETANGSTLELTVPGEALTAIQNELLENEEENISFGATVDKVPVTFRATLTLNVKVTGSPL